MSDRLAQSRSDIHLVVSEETPLTSSQTSSALTADAPQALGDGQRDVGKSFADSFFQLRKLRSSKS